MRTWFIAIVIELFVTTWTHTGAGRVPCDIEEQALAPQATVGFYKSHNGLAVTSSGRRIVRRAAFKALCWLPVDTKTPTARRRIAFLRNLFHRKDIPIARRRSGESNTPDMDLENDERTGLQPLELLVIRTLDSYGFHMHLNSGNDNGVILLFDPTLLHDGILRCCNTLIGNGAAGGVVSVKNRKDRDWLLEDGQRALAEYSDMVWDVIMRIESGVEPWLHVLVERTTQKGRRTAIYDMTPLKELSAIEKSRRHPGARLRVMHSQMVMFGDVMDFTLSDMHLHIGPLGLPQSRLHGGTRQAA